jgi:hypothetical protein
MDSTDSTVSSIENIQAEIRIAIDLVSSVKETMDKEATENTMRIFKFIFNFQKSGFSQHYNVGECIQKHFRLTKENADGLLFTYIENLQDITQKLSSQQDPSTTVQAEQKKRKGPKPYSEMTPEELEAAKAKRQERSKETTIEKTEKPEKKEDQVPKHTEKRVIKLKKTSDAINIWNSFLKVVKAELEKDCAQVSYEEVVKRAKEMKESDKPAYALFSSTWTPEDNTLSNA